MTEPTPLPQPDSERWRPLRAGLVDLFYYDIEEFHFHRGSLLLRGNNGTGKSKVLALTVPFLLDGELAPHRVEPDGDRNKRMEWNLLLGGRHPHPERTGYTWLEFGRRDASGESRFVTIGCGLKAVAGRGIAKHWYFVTDQRVGAELFLVGATRTALTQERLREAIDTRGTVYHRASDYRRAVDGALFGLGSRYEALVSLLIQLRQPQLSKRPDERTLSQALTEALPPLDENLIAQVAEAFRSLDDERTALRALQDARRAADDFLMGYRRYARIAARRRAAGPRQAHSRYEQFGRDLAEQDRAYEQAQVELDAAGTAMSAAREAGELLASRRQALEESPQMRAARDLDQADSHARGLESLASSRRDLLAGAREEKARLVERLSRVAGEHDAAQVALDAAGAEARGAAVAARVLDEHISRVEPVLGADVPPYQDARRKAEAVASWRATSVTNLRELLRKARDTDTDVQRGRIEADERAGELAEAEEQVVAAEATVQSAATELVSALRRHLDEASELRVPDAEALADEVEAWTQTIDGESPATAAITAALTAATDRLARAESDLANRRAGTQAELVDRQSELRRLADGGHDAPPAPYTRSAGARRGPGAPLWKLVDFAPGFPDDDRAGLEAALEAAGLLDAWMTPEGVLLDPATDDVVVTGGAAADHNLAAALRPAINAADPQACMVSAEAVDVVLRHIGLGAGFPTWVDTDGTFANGALRGRWRKPVAVHIGEGARQAARQARMLALRAEIAKLEGDIDALDARLGEIAQRRVVLEGEYAHCPDDGMLREAHAELRSCQLRRRDCAERHRRAVEQAEAAVARAAEATARGQEFAADVDLPLAERDLDAVYDGVARYRTALAGLWHTRALAVAAEARLSEAHREHDAAAERVGPAEAEYDLAEQSARAARERHRALLEASGASVAELQAQLRDLAVQLERVARDEKHARDREREAFAASQTAAAVRENLRAEMQHAAEERDRHVDSLRQFATTGLLAVACPDLEIPDPAEPWAANPAVQVARTVDRALADVDDADRRWQLAQQQVTTDVKTLMDVLSMHGHKANLAVRDDVMLVDVVFQGRSQPIAGLAEALATEVDERQRVLSAHEREVLENHLVNEVAGNLQELITAAERQVATMNEELERRPTSTGMKLRLLWRVAGDAPTGLANLRDRQLRQSTDVWNDEDRRRVGAFLQEQINNERLRNDAGTWLEQLTQALDYRSWHQFTIQRHQHGQWRSATGPASGGERVLAASIPLFAAAASYYSSAGPYAPRLIALDEAFAGVDDDSRAKCLGLLATFDLDVVMTSEREWGCYPQVPGLAIAQLARYADVDAVLVTPWRWDGAGHRYEVQRPVPAIPGIQQGAGVPS